MRIVDKIRAYLIDVLKGEDEERFGSLDSVKALKNTALREAYKGAEAHYGDGKFTAIKDWYLGGGGLSKFAIDRNEVLSLMKEWGYDVHPGNEEEQYNRYFDVIAHITYMS